MDNELTRAIDRLVQDKVFSMEGIEAIKELRDRSANLESNLLEKSKKIEELELGRKELIQENRSLADSVKLLNERDKAMADREAKVFELEKSAAVAVAESKAYKYAMDAVFKPNTIREAVHKTVPVVRNYSDGGGFVETHTQTETVTRDDG